MEILSNIGLVVGVIAFVMAIPPLLQVIYARPLIDIQFGNQSLQVDGQEVNFLRGELRNLPITSRWLRKLRIRRLPAEDVIASFEIREYGTRKMVWPKTIPEINRHSGIAYQRIHLPASLVPATFPIVGVLKTSGYVCPSGEKGPDSKLAVGEYEVFVNVQIDGEYLVKKQKQFM